jgi:anti-repressor protein
MTDLIPTGALGDMTGADSGVMHYPQTGQALRWVRLDGVLWMHFGDVCKGAGHKNPSAAIHLVEEEDKKKIDMRTLSAGQTALTGLRAAITGNAETWFVNEDGFATVGLAGRGDGPRMFRHWVVKVVLKAFKRAHEMAIPKTYPEALELAAKQAREIEAKDAVIEAQQREITTGAPKIEAFHTWLDPHNAVETTVLAKQLGLRSAQELNGLMQRCGIVRKDINPKTGKSRNLPTADWGHCFKVIPTRIPTGGFVDVAWILPEGQLEIVEELRNNGLIDF